MEGWGWAGVNWADRTGMDWGMSGLHYPGFHLDGRYQIGFDWAALEWVDMEHTGHGAHWTWGTHRDWAAMTCTGLGCMGRGGTGRAGLKWIGLSWA